MFRARAFKSSCFLLLSFCDDQPFALKGVSRFTFELSKKLKAEFGSDRRIRTHTDYNEEHRTVVYDYFMCNLLTFAENLPELPVETRKFILREVGLALKNMHAKHWIHLDVKPNNVLLNWSLDESDRFNIERVVLADLDCAWKQRGEELLDYRIGNVMWRSPEGQAAKGVGKPSEVFSFGLLCLFTITGAETLHPDFEDLRKSGVEPEPLILSKLLSMFGPLPPELITHINDEWWNELLTILSRAMVDDDPNERFERWDESKLPNLDSEAKRLTLRMTNLNPKSRATMDQIMDDPWWK